MKSGTITHIAMQENNTLYDAMQEARRRREAHVAQGGPASRHPAIQGRADRGR